ncbi:TetR family transcriptional regulator [Halogeometricum sp. S1BR25-6]|uniref:TetR family transcriptional regulator n=1 Tax=Halogeometricum salsisoli TaxID=2950536 RepID=A0ABU2GI58_9EURY|nr:TetR family transcriptional regulator [Halogeometricum sp. S1BR25-6]MDS0300485.1 TetR family transcriptional regulator [Halogeometricum sp. S1BR25-6]
MSEPPSEPGWARNAVRIARFEYRRSVRGLRESTGRFLLTVLGALFPTAMLVLFGVVVVGFVSADSVPVSDGLRGTVGMFWLFGTYLVAQRVVSTRPRPEAESLLLTTASTRSIAVGLALAETLRFLSYVALPILAVSALLTYAFGALAPLLVVPVVALLAVLTAVLVGSLVGYGTALLLDTSPFVARHKTALGVPLILVLMGGFFVVQAPELVGLDRGSLAWLPSGWFADLAAVGTPLVGSTLRAAVAGVGSLVVLVLGGVLLERETERLWFGDGPATADENHSETETGSKAETGTGTTEWRGLTAAVSPFAVPDFVDLPTRRVAEMSLLRARRDPKRLTFLLTPLFIFSGSLVGVIESLSELLSALPFLLAAFLPWVFGAATTLNFLGDEGSLLPVTLVAATPTQFVRGVLLPCVVYGTPLAAVLTALAAFAGGRSPLAALGLAAAAAFATLVAAPLGVAVGAYMPRFEGVSVARSDEVLPPRTGAVLLHGAAVLVPSGVLALLVGAPELADALLAPLASFASAAPALFRLSLAAAVALVGALVGLTGYRTALHRVRGFDPH